jgi:hypothetical protein
MQGQSYCLKMKEHEKELTAAPAVPAAAPACRKQGAEKDS